ncbi:MAG: potassium transporter [Deltaproteobacteria bacterium CG_4_8_14_3_um_filter_51_11]|nr:TrkH family potassium uptake protein [bacterium]OIP42332.1 MAG: potassium transporter [Desulfobacteraceae bacterium CG2_30_51_40]PIP45767.1 MAG: potassium transporter [Deltaproteobacteria bacterium CG23_combo_of_CG06-09_8_20_14_all_51_20]PIX20027.1 MAG: potassium transporter [Deltaproteobacteria bacterium CG_4_8_14_3_um_filter_51_11]PJB38640.1 MAG: potassium transporter [Deltaproteobacteria bacterium CG_4_9_14_3_um_filter_51_14]
MHWLVILRFIGLLAVFIAAAMLPPLVVSFIYETMDFYAILISIAVSLGVGVMLTALTAGEKGASINHRDGAAIVTFGWMWAGLIGVMPYLLYGAMPSFVDAYFESISGFSTTGASIIRDVEALPVGILLWRSMTQWLGGMGIIVLSIAILPFIGVGGMQLYRAETPSPVVDKLKPRISETARVLWKVYLLFTLSEIVLLAFGGMDILDAVNHSLCTIPTGGFSTRNLSIAYYDNAYFDSVIIFFMLLAGINFSLHYRFLKGNTGAFTRDPECRIYLIVVGCLIGLVALDLYGSVFESFWRSLRAAAFQVASIITTTGFATEDFDRWPSLSKLILLGCMFIGGMAGSTGGGMKVMRIVLLVKHAFQELFRIAHPHAVSAVKLGGKPVPGDVMSSIWGFSILYFLLFIVCTLAMCMVGLDMTSAFSSVAASIGNIGPGLGLVGPTLNYMDVPALGKWILIFCMLVGRLEVYTVLVLLTPEFWKK